MENIESQITQLNTDFESLSIYVQELSDTVSDCVKNDDLNRFETSLNNSIRNRINSEIGQLAESLRNELNQTQESIYAPKADVYTKNEIDNLGFITEHQSLDAYATKDYADNRYVSIYRLDTLLSDKGFVRKSYVENILSDYITNDYLSSYLDDRYYTRTQMEDVVSDMIADSKQTDNTVTKTYVDNLYLELTSKMVTNYYTKNDTNNKYLSKNEHSSFAIDLDDKYVKKSDIVNEINDVITLDGLVTINDCYDFARMSDIDNITNEISTLKASNMSMNQKIASIANRTSTNYYTKSDILSSYLTKEEIEDSFFTITGAKNYFISKEEVSDTYLTKYDAMKTYLAIEDYVKSTTAFSISNSYKDDIETFLVMLENKSLIDGIYVVGDEAFAVVGGERFKVNDSQTTALDVYTRNDIDNFNFATVEWVNNNFSNAGRHEWIITNEY